MRTERQKLRSVYQWAKSRCTNPNVAQYFNYGGRGIQFKFKSFTEFLIEMGPRPDGYSLDRINNNEHYEAGNVRWATRQTQNNNKGSYKTSKTGITGIAIINPVKGQYNKIRYCVRGYINNKRVELYKGPCLEFATFIIEEFNDQKARLHKTS